ncbi:MAG: hypothetical protein JWR75_1991 [Devosia sp.]|nr:hypothetical protein [Devosia sp.]
MNQLNSDDLNPGSAIGPQSFHTDPDDVLNDPDLTVADKRAVLANWASDIRAVRNRPALRRLDNGAVVDIDAILAAMKRLDDIADDRVAYFEPRRARRPHDLRHGQNRLRSWRFWENDDDDDPPPCPATALPWKPLPTLDAVATLEVA